MAAQEWAKFWHNPRLDLGVLHAFYTRHAYPRHSHDYYVISLIDRGLQSFTHGGAKHYTQPGGLILLNPQAVHTGEPASDAGFELRSLYPTAAHMQRIVSELTGHDDTLPYFTHLRIDDEWARASVLLLHRSLTEGASTLECETRFVQTLALLVKRCADIRPIDQRFGRERKTIQQVRQYIDENFADGIRLQDLADYACLSQYHLVNVFHAEVGMPPYAYLESVRIRRAQQLIEAGKPLIDVAFEVGFSSQSHFTHRFKRIIGVTPGQYAKQRRH